MNTTRNADGSKQMNNLSELKKYLSEYKEANTQFYDCLKLGDDKWELYQKRMACAWKKIKICLDTISPLNLEDIQTIAEYAREQDSQYIGDCVNLYAKFKGDVE
jgi:hypothetical protein